MKSAATPRIVVISDLHIGSGPLDDCDKGLESKLVDFFNGLSNDSPPTTLVINGDFLDFVQAEPWQGDEIRSQSPEKIPLCFTNEQSLAKAESICDTHPSIFTALDSFLVADPNNRLVIVPGNHDVDFFWPGVRDFIKHRLPGTSRSTVSVSFHLDEIYRPSSRPNIWIEHGHQHDPCNAFRVSNGSRWRSDFPPIFKDIHGQERLFECTGTRFLLTFLNRLDKDYPFVDNVKPFSRFLRIFGASALRPGAAPLKAAVAIWSMMKFLGKSVLHHPLDLLSMPGTADLNPQETPGLLFSGLSNSQQSHLQDILVQSGFHLDLPLAMFVSDRDSAELLIDFLADHMQILDEIQKAQSSLLSLDKQPGTLTLAKEFALDETGRLADAAAEALSSSSVEAVIMGHTHEPIESSPKLAYINTGSWTRNLDFKRGESLSSWSLLDADGVELFPYQLNFADIPSEHTSPPQFRTFHKQEHFGHV